MPRYFEIYVPGHDGYSLYVSTTFPLSNSLLWDQVLALALRASVINKGDAKDVQYIEERTLKELTDAGIQPIQLATI